MGHVKKGRVIILSGPSGAGKTTIHEKLLGSKAFRHRIVRSVSMTTRPRRSGERQGKDYVFVSPKMFAYKKDAGHFLEWAKVFGHYYGTPFKPVRDLLKIGKSVLLCIDVQGARQIRKKCPDAVSIFVKPPSLDALQDRLAARGTEDGAVLAQRLKTAKEEMRESAWYDYSVVNDDLDQACREVESFLAERI